MEGGGVVDEGGGGGVDFEEVAVEDGAGVGGEGHEVVGLDVEEGGEDGEVV